MPELPEVETIKLGLQKKIVGLEIKKVELIQPKSFIGDPKQIEGLKVLRVWRRAKILGIELSSNFTLSIHLKMSGQLVWRGKSTSIVGGHPTEDMLGPMPHKHSRIVFEFNDDSHLYFNDLRRFGWIRVSDTGEVIRDKFLTKLGPEPLEKSFTWQILKTNLLRYKSMPVKVAILDQKVVSGIGNIYASEACFNARIDPRTKISELTDSQFKKLHSGIIKALQDGVHYGGSTRANFVDSEGRKGYFLDYAFVYGKDKTPCKICGSLIEKTQLRGRGTYFCPSCQK